MKALVIPRVTQCTCSQAYCISKVIVKHDGITAKATQMALLTPHELQISSYCLIGNAGATSLSFTFFRRIRVASFLVVVLFRFRQSPSPSRRDTAFAFPVLSFRRIHLLSRVVLLRVVLFFFRAVFVFRLSCSLCVSVFRRGASFVVRVSSSYVVLRPMRLLSAARPLIAVFAPFSCSFFAPRNTMPADVDIVTPVASSFAGNDTSNAVPPVASVPSIPSSFPAPSSNVAGPSTAPVATPSSAASDAMMTSLFDTVRSRAPVVPVVAPIVPSTPSVYTRCTGGCYRRRERVRRVGTGGTRGLVGALHATPRYSLPLSYGLLSSSSWFVRLGRYRDFRSG